MLKQVQHDGDGELAHHSGLSYKPKSALASSDEHSPARFETCHVAA